MFSQRESIPLEVFLGKNRERAYQPQATEGDTADTGDAGPIGGRRIPSSFVR